ncbi:MAG: energy-coupling factor transporter transmembrane component T [Clostridiales bacterium]
MKNLTLGQYYPGNSFLHKMDPRAKITALFLYFIFLFIIKDVPGYVLATVLGIGMMVFSAVPLRVYWRGSRFIIFFAVIAALFNMFFTPGEVIWAWGMIKLTVEGIYSAVFMAVRLVLLIVSAFVLTYTTTPMAVTDALEKMGAPLARIKVPIHDIAMVMSIALRFIPTIMDEVETIKKAQQSRGAEFNLHRPGLWLQNMISMVVPLFVSAFRRSEDLALAMEARGYVGGEGRTMFRELKLRYTDIIVMTIFVLLNVAYILYGWLK